MKIYFYFYFTITALLVLFAVVHMADQSPELVYRSLSSAVVVAVFTLVFYSSVNSN